MSGLLYMIPIDAVRRCGLSLEELMPHVVTIAGEQRIAVATVERLRAERGPLARAEQDKYIAGEMNAGDRKY